MRVARAQALRGVALAPCAVLRPRAFAAPPLARRAAAAAAAPRAVLLTPASHARALLSPPLRRGFCGDTKALAMAPQQTHLRPQGRALAAVAGLGVAAAAASFAAATLVGSLLLAALAVLDARLARAAPEVITGAGPRTRARLASAPSLTAPYRPFPGLRHRHASTIWPAYFRSVPSSVAYWRECVRMADGGHVTLDWLQEAPPAVRGAHVEELVPGAAPSALASAAAEPLVPTAQPPLRPDSPVMLLLSGIAGGSADTYVKHFVAAARAQGFRPVCFNSRGCANGPVTVPQFYSASFTGDLREVVPQVRARFPSAPLFAIGWSLGANILVNYLGEEGAAGRPPPVDAAASMCNPFDLVTCDRALEHGMGRVYSRSMGDGLRRIFAPHAALFAGLSRFDAAGAIACRTVREFDEAITRRSFGFASVDDYYRASGSAMRLPSVAVPLLCVQAADDPIAVNEAIPRAAAAANPNVALVVTPSGGHLGWITEEAGVTGAPGPDRGVLEWFSAVAAEWAADRASGDAAARGKGRAMAAAGRD